jgi:hypothetical protein
MLRLNDRVLRGAAAVFVTAGIVGGSLWLVEKSALAQTRAYRAPRTPDGKPNLSGIWQALTTANWDLLDHAARPGAVVAFGALGAVPGGVGVVEGNEIPYKPEAAAKKKENFDNWLLRDPLVKCYMPGVPRATYLPFPFQIVQSADALLIAYEFANASRTIYINSKEESPLDSWMGWSRGHWEGETLVVDVTNFNDRTWFDSAGDFHSEALHVVERYTATGPDHLMYEATIEDPNVFTRPWKIRMPLYRRVEPRAELVEFRCVEFAEELMYGHLRKQADR